MSTRNKVSPLSLGELRYNTEKHGKSFIDSLLRPGTIECLGDPSTLIVFIGTCQPINKQEIEDNIARYGVWFGRGPYNKNGYEIGREDQKHYAWNTSARLMSVIAALETIKEEILNFGSISQVVVVNALEYFTVAATEKVPATLHYLQKHKNPAFIRDNAASWQELFDKIKEFQKRDIRVAFHTDLGGPDPNIVTAENLARDKLYDVDAAGRSLTDVGVDSKGLNANMEDYLEPLQDDNWADVNVPDWREDFVGDMEFLKKHFPELNQ
jgi:hypothetical protein